MVNRIFGSPALAASKSTRRVINRLFLIGLGLLIPLLLLEFSVRAVGLAPPATPNPAIWSPHPLFGWWHIPYSGGIFYSDFNEFEAEVQINARGLRDREIGYENSADALRVLSLADSFGEALQVNLEDTYHKQLETRLNAALGRPVQVLNAGVGGWGTDQEAIFYVAEGFRYAPDVVLLAFFIRNDAVNNYGPLEIARNGGSQRKKFFSLSTAGALIPPPLEGEAPAKVDETLNPELAMEDLDPPLLATADVLWRMSGLYRFMTPYLRDVPPILQRLGPTGLLGGEAVVRATHPVTPIPFLVYQTPPDEQFEAAWRLTEAILGKLRDEVESRGSHFVVVIIGAPEQIEPDKLAGLATARPNLTWDVEAPNRRLVRFLAAEKISHLDLLPLFRKAAARPEAKPLHFRHDQHWTEAGHSLAAEAIEAFLLEEFGETLEK